MLIRGFGYQPGRDKYAFVVMELAGSQAQIVYDFKRQTHIESRKISKVPTFLLDASTPIFATSGQAIRANLFLNCVESDHGIMICSRTQRYYEKQFLLSAYFNKHMKVDRFLSHGVEIHKNVLPTVEDIPVELEVNLVEFTCVNELRYEKTLNMVTAASSVRSITKDALTTNFLAQRSKDYTPSYMVPETYDSTVELSGSDDEGNTNRAAHGSASRNDQGTANDGTGSTFRAGMIVSELTGQVSLLTHQSIPIPFPTPSFLPNATSTEDEPRGPTSKGKSRDGTGKKSGHPAPRVALTRVDLPNNQVEEDLHLSDSPIVPSIQAGDSEMLDIFSPGRDLIPIEMAGPTNKENIPVKKTKKRRRSIGKSTTMKRPRKNPRKKIILTPGQRNTIDSYYGRRARYVWYKRSLNRRHSYSKRSPTPSPTRVSPSPASTSKQTPPSKSSTSANSANSTMSPIPPLTNITIPLPDSPVSNSSNTIAASIQSSAPPSAPLSTQSSAQSNSTHNSRISDDPQDVESSSVMFVTNDPIINMGRSPNITCPDIHYNSSLQGVEMPLFPDPTWRQDPARIPTVELPEHVIIVADPSTNVVEQRYWLNVRSDPWQVIEAIRTNGITTIQDEGYENSDNAGHDNISIYQDPVIPPYPFPDPVPCLPQQPRPVSTLTTSRPPLRQISVDYSAINRFILRPSIPLNIAPPLPVLDDSRLFSTSNPSTGSRLFPTPESSAPSSDTSASQTTSSNQSIPGTSSESNSSLSVNFESESSWSMPGTSDSSLLQSTDTASSTDLAEKQEDKEEEE